MLGWLRSKLYRDKVEKGSDKDVRYLEYIVERFLHSKKRLDMITGERYYLGHHDILWTKREVIGEGGRLTEVDNLPNNKRIDNQYEKLVDQKVNYLLGKPITFQSENEIYQEQLEKVFGLEFHKIIKNLGEDALNGGIAWIYPHYNDKGEFVFKRFEPYQILPVWKDEGHTDLEFVIRIYTIQEWTGSIHTGLTQSLIRGGNLDDVVNDISQFVSSKIKNKKYVASRLVTTESAAYASKAQEQAYKDLSVDKYEILATLDLHTSDICQDLDGKIFDRKDYQVGVTAPPFHPNCRTVTVPWFLDDVDTGERVARGKDGKVGYVPQNMTYKEWYNKYVEQKFEENGIIELDSNSNNPVIRRCIEKQIEYIGIEKSSTIPLEEAIISELGGGDKTRGSCSSLAFAYIGNKNGYKVLDFRGGNSQAIFASNKTILEITELEGIKSWVVYEKNDFTAIKKLITNMEEKREYYLAIGRHAAIIRKIEKGYEYLELQSAKYNGFKTFDMNVLKNRFGCQKSYRRAGMTLAPPSMLIDIDTLKDNKEFNQMLGFINTAKEKQLKGVEGYEK